MTLKVNHWLRQIHREYGITADQKFSHSLGGQLSNTPKAGLSKRHILSESSAQIGIVGKTSICLKHGKSLGERNLNSCDLTIMRAPTKTTTGHHH
mgnify:CR=1 FL=1